MMPASLRINASVQWRNCRNILMALIAVQMLTLIYLGFSIPSVSNHLYDSINLQQPQQQVQKEQHGKTDTSGAGGGAAGGGGVVWNDVSIVNNKPQYAAIDTGPFDIPGAYFGNFQLQREQPEFRKVALPGDDKRTQAEATVSKLLENQPTVKSCHSFEQARRLERDECQSKITSKLVAYNSHSTLTRTWCGTSLAPGEAKVVQCDNNEPVRLYSHDSPPVNGEGMPPIQFIRKNAPASSVLEDLQQCPIPCQVTMDICGNNNEKRGMDCLPNVSDWSIVGTDWQFTFYNKIAGQKVDRKAYRQFHFSASESFQSDVPLSTFEFSPMEAPPAVDFDVAAKSVSFIETPACHGESGTGIRGSAWASIMNQKAKLASYCHCEHNTELPEGLRLTDKEHRQILMKQHLFTLIIELSLENDFIDSLVWEALHAGVIPVYYGASNIADHVPPNSIISANAIGSKEGTAALVMEIANNKTLWETYHAWRKEPFPDALRQKFDFLKTDAYCRVCKWSYAKRYGLGWNHEHQTIEEPVLSSRAGSMCVSQDGFLVQPFRETWFASSKPESSAKTAVATDCADASRTQTIQDDLFTVHRTLSHHDSIMDIVIPEIKSSHDEEVALRLEVPIQNWEGAHFRDVHQLFQSQHVGIYSSVAIQDRRSRLTILTNWQTQLRCPNHGTVEIVVQDANEENLPSGEIRKIRVILEDTSSLHDVMTEYGASPFAQRVIQDFLDPLELFYIQT